jgi:hypothetical protein
MISQLEEVPMSSMIESPKAPPSLTVLMPPAMYERVRRAAYDEHSSMGDVARRAIVAQFPELDAAVTAGEAA